MAVPPIRYRTTDYPPKYRPLGYWRHARRQAEAPDDGAAPDRWRRRFLILLAVLLATLVLHAGIAFAYLGAGSDGTSSEKAAKGATDPAASRDDPGQPDPAAEEESSPIDEVPVPGTGEGTGTGELDPSTPGGASRGAL